MHFESGKLMVYKPNYVLLPRPAKLGYSTMLYTMLSRRLIDCGRSSNHLYRAHSMMLKDLIWMSVVRERSSNLRRYASVSWWQGNVIVGNLLLQFYGRSLPSITVYTNEMMTKLGQVGKDLSELPLEMNHNFLSEDICRREGLMFIDKDGNIKDFSSLSIN